MPPIRPQRLRRRILGVMLGPILEMEDTAVFRAAMIVHTPPPDDSWVLSASALQQQRDSIRPDIGGDRISMLWLQSLRPGECLHRFRFYADELQTLAMVLQIPHPFKTVSGSVFSNVEALCLLIARLKSASDEFDLSMQYDRAQSAISEVVNELVIWLDNRWNHLLDFDTAGILAPARMQEYATAIFEAGAPLNSVWGFIDCTIRAVCRPSVHQRIAYNGYKKIHALKFQAVKLPNGLTGHLFGPMEGRRNDNALLAESQLLQKCTTDAFRLGADQNTPISQRYFQLFGDPAYGITPLMLSPYAGAGDRTENQTAWNAAMAAVRIEVEHGFGDIVREWPFLNAWWKHHIYTSPVGRYYRIGVLLTNALNCLQPNQTAQYFRCSPPTLAQYFHN